MGVWGREEEIWRSCADVPEDWILVRESQAVVQVRVQVVWPFLANPKGLKEAVCPGTPGSGQRGHLGHGAAADTVGVQVVPFRAVTLKATHIVDTHLLAHAGDLTLICVCAVPQLFL